MFGKAFGATLGVLCAMVVFSVGCTALLGVGAAITRSPSATQFAEEFKDEFQKSYRKAQEERFQREAEEREDRAALDVETNTASLRRVK